MAELDWAKRMPLAVQYLPTALDSCSMPSDMPDVGEIQPVTGKKVNVAKLRRKICEMR